MRAIETLLQDSCLARRRASAALILSLLALSGCGPTGAYTWVDKLPAAELTSASAGAYVIDAGDLLSIRVYNQEAMSTRARVRPDGKISMPLIGDIEVRGRRPTDVAKDLEERMKTVIVAPAVTVTAEETQPLRISVLGEVNRPGAYVLEAGSGVLQALALGGGLTEFADDDRLFVLRSASGGATQRIRFTYEDLTQASGKGAAFSLRSGDVVFVE
jgi:polysaccharide biosynthesis/export protein